MPGEFGAWDQAALSRAIRRRKITRIILVILLAFLIGSSALDHIRAGIDDWSRFDTQIVRLSQSQSPNELLANRHGETNPIPIHLAGIGPLGRDWNQRCQDRLAELSDVPLTLHLQPTQTRDGHGKLLALAFLPDQRCLNAELIQEGLAKVDRSIPVDLLPTLLDARAQARQRGSGFWRQYRHVFDGRHETPPRNETPPHNEP